MSTALSNAFLAERDFNKALQSATIEQEREISTVFDNLADETQSLRDIEEALLEFREQLLLQLETTNKALNLVNEEKAKAAVALYQ